VNVGTSGAWEEREGQVAMEVRPDLLSEIKHFTLEF